VSPAQALSAWSGARFRRRVLGSRRMADIQSKLDYVQAVAEWFLDLGDDQFRRGNLEAALKNIHVASIAFTSQNRDLTSTRVESNIRQISARLAEQGVFQEVRLLRNASPKRCLHVMTEAHPAGGHTAMATRWTKIDRGRCHSLALLSQEIPVPASLRQAVEASGGQVYLADPASSFLDRARWLRGVAANEADCVILHIALSDVICGAAFGLAGGPPVMLVNHAGHLYWNGASTIDQIANCRGSKLEVSWSANYRGVGAARSAIVPIPLEDPDPHAVNPASRLEIKRRAREKFGIAQDATVILTVGARYKYHPIDDLDFTEVWTDILDSEPNAELIAVGFEGDQRWKNASLRVGNRIRTLGTMPNARLQELITAADIYVEAFPFGTTTSLLEAGLKGVPVALAPAQAPPPYGTDGIALDDILPRPSSLSDYKAGIRDLCRSADHREAVGNRVRDSILRHHCDTGWKGYLEAALASLPPEHGIFSEIAPERTPPEIHTIWSRFVPQWTNGHEHILETTVTQALAMGLRPRLTVSMREGCRRHRAVRRGQSIPIPLLALLLNAILPLLPNAGATVMFRACAFLCRGALLPRTWKKIASLTGLERKGYGAGEEYREMREAEVAKNNAPTWNQNR
jgi:hypothetical protein